ncbi:hypothetical protein ACGRPS_15380 [Vibrio furnissii]|uniref:hypothetical protein n=1 Tax=Vibrio furnissii TaxID=29494 RepID=UPI00374A1B13
MFAIWPNAHDGQPASAGRTLARQERIIFVRINVIRINIIRIHAIRISVSGN